jgi:streptogramin lyase
MRTFPLKINLKVPYYILLSSMFFYTATACNAQSGPVKWLLALSKTDHTLAVVDPVSLKILTRIPVGIDPHEVASSSDGKTAYVTIYGGGSLHELDIIDLVARRPLQNLDTKPLFGPHGLTFVNEKAWFTAEGSKSIGCFDPSTGKIEWSMGHSTLKIKKQ